MYFEFDDARRIHQPYTDSYVRSKYHLQYLSPCSAILEDASLQLANAKLAAWHVLDVVGHLVGK